MKKLLFIGVKADLSDFLVRAQEEGVIEFILPQGRGKHHFPPEVQKLIDAIKVLRKQPVKALYRKGGTLTYANEVAEQILQLKNAIEKQEEEKRLLEIEITRVAPFGHFSFQDIAFIENQTGFKVQFFCVKTNKRELIVDEPELIYIGTEYDLDYFIAINRRPRSYPKMIEMHLNHSANERRNHLAFLDEALHQMLAELKGFAGHIDFLRDALLERFDIHSLNNTKKNISFPIEGVLFSIEAWIPENKLQKISPVIADSAIHFETIPIESSDRIPTYMENKGCARLGEDLVRLYDIPAATDKDPSAWVFWSFLLFFSMIIADGGYGLFYLLLALFLKKKFSHLKGSAKRLMKLSLFVATGCIVWGLLTTSFFGLSFNPEGPIGRLSPLSYLAEKKADYHLARHDEAYQTWVKEYPSLISAKRGRDVLEGAVKEETRGRVYELLDAFSDSILLEISVLIGLIHTCLSLLRYVVRSFANLGWIIFAIGGYLYIPIFLQATSLLHFLGLVTPEVARTLGLQLIFIGIGFAVIVALIQKRLKGVGEVMQGIQIFSDIISYLRLYALALASTIMARTFNEMGSEINFAFGALVIIFGHGINIVLGTMSGVIHGLRLNFIEWYHYCFEGDGRLFQPLRKLKKLKTLQG